MSIYIMKGSTFKNIYAKTEDPTRIFRTQHIIVSSRIRSLDKYHDIVKLANMKFFPDDSLLSDFGIYDKEYFEREYKKQLRSARGDLARFVYNSMVNKKTFIFICSDTEWKLGYLKVMKKYIKDFFHYPVYDYKKYKNGEESYQKFNKDEVYKICKKELETERSEMFDKLMQTPKGRKKLLKNLSTREMETILKNSDLYMDGMSKTEMKYVLKTYVLY